MKEVNHRSVERQELLNNDIKLVIYPGHPFQLQKTIPVQQIADEPMVFFECGSFDWNRVYHLFETANIAPKIEFQVDHLEVAKSVILNKQAIGFLPSLSIKDELQRGELIEADLSFVMQIHQPIYAARLLNSFVQLSVWDDILLFVKQFKNQRLISIH